MIDRRDDYVKRFGLKRKHRLSPHFMDQLDKCKDDSARRVLLGVSASSATDLSAPYVVEGSYGIQDTWRTSSAKVEADLTVSKMLSLSARTVTSSKSTTQNQ